MLIEKIKKGFIGINLEDSTFEEFVISTYRDRGSVTLTKDELEELHEALCGYFVSKYDLDAEESEDEVNPCGRSPCGKCDSPKRTKKGK